MRFASLPAVMPLNSVDGGTACGNDGRVEGRVSRNASSGKLARSVAGGELLILKYATNFATITHVTRSVLTPGRAYRRRRDVGVGIRRFGSIGTRLGTTPAGIKP